MADTTDRVAAEIAAIRQRSDAPLGPHAGSLPIGNEAVRRLMESAADVPRLLAAVEAALALHKPMPRTWISPCEAHSIWCALEWSVVTAARRACLDCTVREVRVCAHCDRELACPDDAEWLCPTARAITSALLGEDGT